ncbi:hypothetical protein LP7551_03864 [Roseibium album]|nr:hypothetical protein LP7551_03864 [Roseibium album]
MRAAEGKVIEMEALTVCVAGIILSAFAAHRSDDDPESTIIRTRHRPPGSAIARPLEISCQGLGF